MHCRLLKDTLSTIEDGNIGRRGWFERFEEIFTIVDNGCSGKFSVVSGDGVEFVHVSVNKARKHVIKCQSGFCQWKASKQSSRCEHERLVCSYLQSQRSGVDLDDDKADEEDTNRLPEQTSNSDVVGSILVSITHKLVNLPSPSK